MSLPFAIGFAVGISIVAIVTLLIKAKGKKCEYDERQVAMRGIAFKTGFITFVLCETGVFFAEILMSKPLVFFEPGILNLSIILFSLMIFVLVAIFNDAYFSPNKPMSKRWFIVMVILGIVTLLRGFTADELWYKVLNLEVGAFVIIIMLGIVIKMLITRKAGKEEEAE